MPNLLTVSKSFLEWAQSLPDVVIPAGLESDMQEAITSSEAVEHTLAPDGAYLCGKCGLMSRTTKCENCGHIYERPARGENELLLWSSKKYAR